MILKIAIALYIIPLFCFYTFLALGKDYSDTIYFMWDKFCTGSFISWAVIYTMAGSSSRYVVPVLAFSFVRVIWEIISKITGITATNDARIASLFIFLTISTGWLIFNKESYVTKFLEKKLKRLPIVKKDSP